jgi:hypothetical protein
MSCGAAIKRCKDNEAEDMDGDHQHGKQADLESGLETKAFPRPTHITAREFVHWLAAKSRIDDDNLRSLFKR